MTEMNVTFHRKDDPPATKFPVPCDPILHSVAPWHLVVMEEGMASGEPSVMLMTHEPKTGIGIAVETSLDKFIMGAQSMLAFAKEKFDWTPPEGSATVAPNDAGIGQAKYHVNEDGAPTGDPCYDRTCSHEHADVVWRAEP